MDWVRVEGQSMQPFLRSGEWVGIDWCNPLHPLVIQPGELLLTRDTDGSWIVHRVVQVETEPTPSVWIKGDAAFVKEKLGFNQIWGRVKAIRPSLDQKTLWVSLCNLDRWISFCLRINTPAASLREKIIRRGVILLSSIRRKMISKSV